MREDCRPLRAPSVRASIVAWQGRLVASGAHLGDVRDLRLAHGVVIHVEKRRHVVLVRLVAVDADDHVLAPVEPRLATGRGLLDAQLRHACGHGLGHAAERLDLIDQLLRLVRERGGERLHVVGAAQRVHHAGHPGLVLQDELGVARDAGGEIGGQRHRLVQRIGV